MPINIDAVQSAIIRKGAYLLDRIQDGDEGSPDSKTRKAFVEILCLAKSCAAEVRFLEAQYNLLHMENGALHKLLTEIGIEILSVEENGYFCAEQGESSFMHSLAKRLNEILI